MTGPGVTPAGQADVEAALLLWGRLGVSTDDLVKGRPAPSAVPTFAEYIPVVSAAVGDGSRRAYTSYWNRVLEQWSDRRLDEVMPSDIEKLVEYVRAHRVVRSNARSGRSAAENLITALRCLYRRAVADGYLTEAQNPALRVAKPQRLQSTRRALADTRVAEINRIAATTGDDPVLDSLLLRLHTETACRRGGALALQVRFSFSTADSRDLGGCAGGSAKIMRNSSAWRRRRTSIRSWHDVGVAVNDAARRRGPFIAAPG